MKTPCETMSSGASFDQIFFIKCGMDNQPGNIEKARQAAESLTMVNS